MQDFEKRPKPVVLVKKLSIDQIQRIIRHSKSGKNRISSGKSSKGNRDFGHLDNFTVSQLPLHVFPPRSLLVKN